MERLVRHLCLGLQYVAQFVLFIMAIMVTLDVLGRWLFKSPIIGTVDIVEVGLIIVIFASLAFTHLKEEHITVDFVVEKFPKRIQSIIEMFINLCITVVMLLISWSLWGNAIRLMESNTVTGDIRLPLHIFAFFAVIGTVLFALVSIIFIFKYGQKVVKKDES
ncbi:TRAP transporter small permease [Tenuibacillus multivorans]|uniref:TRAP-type C4-dicarboxylate transport system, small permease component n=1 Tax=Tenuibacillus multivorans TaxID=237069 RepID=A0A1H0ESB2_9BACI|nr:TRAP transporter small permease [Tenuibacillus multivorans]GEL76974.1 hypothetical protein TMU01_12090 [Tenuibacillus multivorans]SDN85294.1 TRAP-type C4-dicarboxylate transport system, small permease component [Tenuibacillus multivorans]